MFHDVSGDSDEKCQSVSIVSNVSNVSSVNG